MPRRTVKELEEQYELAKKTHSEAQSALKKIQSIPLDTVMHQVSEIQAMHQKAEKPANDIKLWWAKGEQQHLDLVEYKKTYEQFIKQISATEQKINELLHKATSFSLSSAFETRRKKLSKQRLFSQLGFIISLAAFIFIAISIDVSPATEGTSLLLWFLDVLKSFGLLAAPIWGAYYCTSVSHSIQRLEEFYAHKETIAKAYSGYKAELEDLVSEDERFDELIRLMEINLDAISKDSGDILNKKAPRSPIERASDMVSINKKKEEHSTEAE